jgi:excinuclease ABC subunit C
LNPEGEGPVATQEQIQQYKNNIKAVKDILNGRRQSLIKEIKKEMKDIAEEENFEKAIELRDRLEKIKNVFENAKIIKDIAEKGDVLAQIKKTLDLSIEPRRIEGYDIANIQGKFATGSMVVFTDGNPDKKEYKKFKIRFTSEGGDTAMLEEILRRRFKHTEWQFPDLIIVDGGKAQLNAVLNFLKLSGNSNIPVIALTKNDHHYGDHIYISTKKNLPRSEHQGCSATGAPINLRRLPDNVRNLILQIDSEAHRFAIGYYRKLHRTANL